MYYRFLIFLAALVFLFVFGPGGVMLQNIFPDKAETPPVETDAAAP